MKVLSLCVLKWKSPPDTKEPVMLSANVDVSEFGFFKRGGVQQFLLFTSRTLIKRAKPGTRESCAHQDYMCHYYLMSDGLGAVLICDQEYNKRVAFAVVADLIDQYRKHAGTTWQGQTKDNQAPFKPGAELLIKCQDPANCDKITKIHRDLDATKAVLHKTIDSVLERGAKLDDLVNKSDDLSMQSKLFYKTAADQNKCCIIS